MKRPRSGTTGLSFTLHHPRSKRRRIIIDDMTPIHRHHHPVTIHVDTISTQHSNLSTHSCNTTVHTRESSRQQQQHHDTQMNNDAVFTASSLQSIPSTFSSRSDPSSTRPIEIIDLTMDDGEEENNVVNTIHHLSSAAQHSHSAPRSFIVAVHQDNIFAIQDDEPNTTVAHESTRHCESLTAVAAAADQQLVYKVMNSDFTKDGANSALISASLPQFTRSTLTSCANNNNNNPSLSHHEQSLTFSLTQPLHQPTTYHQEENHRQDTCQNNKDQNCCIRTREQHCLRNIIIDRDAMGLVLSYLGVIGRWMLARTSRSMHNLVFGEAYRPYWDSTLLIDRNEYPPITRPEDRFDRSYGRCAMLVNRELDRHGYLNGKHVYIRYAEQEYVSTQMRRLFSSQPKSEQTYLHEIYDQDEETKQELILQFLKRATSLTLDGISDRIVCCFLETRPHHQFRILQNLTLCNIMHQAMRTTVTTTTTTPLYRRIFLFRTHVQCLRLIRADAILHPIILRRLFETVQCNELHIHTTRFQVAAFVESMIHVPNRAYALSLHRFHMHIDADILILGQQIVDFVCERYARYPHRLPVIHLRWKHAEEIPEVDGPNQQQQQRHHDPQTSTHKKDHIQKWTKDLCRVLSKQ